ncbi:MAG: hypothetical protein ABSA33_00220 [Candidatus Micrarchaeaceae archaeon]|jgi:hypothetical protein
MATMLTTPLFLNRDGRFDNIMALKASVEVFLRKPVETNGSKGIEDAIRREVDNSKIPGAVKETFTTELKRLS